MKKYTIGIDIGGTNMKAVLFNGEKIIMDYSLATPRDTLDHLIIMIIALVKPLEEKARGLKVKIDGIGLSVAGTHDFAKGIITDSPNIPLLNGVELKKLIAEKLGMTVEMDNDGNCFVRAEVKLGAAKKHKNVYGIIISTGIGGGWWFKNRAYRGEHGGAGEPGAMIIDFGDLINLEESYKKLNQNNSLNLATEAYRGDELAKKAYEEIGKLLGVACANIINILDPEVIVIGGGATDSSDLFFSQIKKTIPKLVLNTLSKKTKIIKGKLGNDSGAIGAALLFN